MMATVSSPPNNQDAVRQDPSIEGDTRELHQRLERLEAEFQALRCAVLQTRLYAGDRLPAKVGLVIVKMLEDALVMHRPR
ncbi:hypothetical protein ACUN9Y_11810 [Halomonas sp. V046]|uniref:hypothetical protein n=1 Tax=Halomonas sp. V046 TaxID=3459611 RepID=UPI004043AE90